MPTEFTTAGADTAVENAAAVAGTPTRHHEKSRRTCLTARPNATAAKEVHLNRGLFSLFAAFFLLTPTGVSQCGVQINGLPVQNKLVAKLRAKSDKGTELGSAIYVGTDRDRAYLITAAHVVFPIDSDGPVTSAEVKFSDSPQWIAASILPTYKRALDLAVVSINLGSLPTDLPHATAAQPELGTVHIVGNPAAGDSNVWTGVIQNKNAENADVQHFTTNFDQSLAGGYSGGAVFDSFGRLVGMHTSSTQSYGVALKISEIGPQLQAWTIPMTNVGSASRVVVASDTGLPEPDWATISNEKLLTADELELSRIGEGAFQCGRYEWSMKFFERAKQVQKSRVWESDLPLYAASLMILGKPQEGKDALKEMESEMVRPYSFMRLPPPIAVAIQNLEKAKLKAPVAYRADFDSSIRYARALLQQICNGNMSRPCQVALSQ